MLHPAVPKGKESTPRVSPNFDGMSVLQLVATGKRLEIHSDNQMPPTYHDIIIVRSTTDAGRLIPDRHKRDLATHLFQEDAS